MATAKQPRPYWLGGTELCELCECRHVLQQQYRCAACDRASCEHCVEIDPDTGEVLCHECRNAPEEGG